MAFVITAVYSGCKGGIISILARFVTERTRTHVRIVVVARQRNWNKCSEIQNK